MTADSEIFSLMYLQMVEGARPDVFILTHNNFFYKKVKVDFPNEFFYKIPIKQKEKILEIAWESAKKNSFPLYTNFIVNEDTSRNKKFASRSNGITYKVYEDINEARKDQRPYLPQIIMNLDEPAILEDYSARGFISHYYYNLANYYLENNNQDKSRDYLVKAIELDPRAYSLEYQDFIRHREEWQKK